MRIGRDLDALNGTYDVVVLGGGITGTAIAREAAVRGLKVCLVEKNDFGWSTSAATSKLIHGGLRYLDKYEFTLVRESLRERRILGCAAPHLIQPLPFILPIYVSSRPGRYTYQAGLTLYDLLSFERNWRLPPEKRMPGFRWLKKDAVMAEEPMVDPHELTGGFRYYDYQSLYPERLTLAFVKTAVEAGAVLVNHAQVEDLETTRLTPAGRRVTSMKVRDVIGGKLYHVHGRMFINASGPWTDILLGLVEKNPAVQLSRSKGVHLLTDTLLGTGHGVIFRTRAGGHFFILPWMGHSLIGPTDAPFTGHPDQLRPEADDVQELIDDVNSAIPGRPLKPSMIRYVVIGLRPLIASKESTYHASRKSEIFDHAHENIQGFISVAGGKWTTSRQLGEDVIHEILKKPEMHNVRTLKKNTAADPLYGAPGFGASADEYAAGALTQFSHPAISADVHRHLITLYGTEHTRVLELLKEDKTLAHRISARPGHLDILAQVVFAVQNETAITLEDIFARRLGMGSLGRPLDKEIELVAALAAKLLKWNAARKRQEIQSLKAFYPDIKSLCKTK